MKNLLVPNGCVPPFVLRNHSKAFLQDNLLLSTQPIALLRLCWGISFHSETLGKYHQITYSCNCAIPSCESLIPFFVTWIVSSICLLLINSRWICSVHWVYSCLRVWICSNSSPIEAMMKLLTGIYNIEWFRSSWMNWCWWRNVDRKRIWSSTSSFLWESSSIAIKRTVFEGICLFARNSIHCLDSSYISDANRTHSTYRSIQSNP